MPLVLPIGAEETFKGIADLITIKANCLGTKKPRYDLQRKCRSGRYERPVVEYRAHLVEAVAEYDDALLEKYFDNPESITEDELINAIRKATIDIAIILMLCGSAFKNKGFSSCWMPWFAIFLRRSILMLLKVANPDTEEEVLRKPDERTFHCTGL